MSKVSSIGPEALMSALSTHIRLTMQERVLENLVEEEVAKYRAKITEVLKPEVEKLTLKDIQMYHDITTLQTQLQVKFNWGSALPA